MTTVYETQNCTDFGTSTGLSREGKITAFAWKVADERGDMNEAQKRAFTQGFIHGFQGRADLHSKDSNHYADGYNMALFCPAIH